MSYLDEKQDFWLADWQVRPSLGVIERDGKSISLEPKVMAVLVTLASEPGQVFSRQALEEQVWQGSIVGYDALAKAINKLREALGDDSKAPRYIQTISKKGYRLVATVHADVPVDKNHGGEKKPASRLWTVSGALVIVLLLVGLFVFYPSGNEVDGTRQVATTSQDNSKPTIVVLPFQNISPSETDDYLADGLTSDLTTNLSKISGLWVTASTATRAYRNTDYTLDKVKQEFNARYAISGEVNRIGQAIRINVHLNDIDKGTILWADRYDRQFTDLFAIQDEVTQKILDSLSLTMTREERQRVAKRYTNNLEAYEIFLRGQFLLNARTPEDNSRSRELYRRAIELDPGFARAYASMAYSYAIGYIRQWPADVQEPLEKAFELAQRAIALDEDLPEAYWAAAFVYFYREDTARVKALMNKVLEINPNYADAYAMLASNYTSEGDPQRTLDIMVRAYQLNPVGGYLYDMQLARAYYFLEDYELAHQYLVEALERNPAYIDLQMYMSATLVRMGRNEEAAWMILEARQTNPGFDPHSWVNGYPFTDGKGYRKKLLNDINEAVAYSQK